MTGRVPSVESLEASTARLRASNDRLANGTPIVTDEQRLAVCRELVAYQYKHGQTHLEQALWAFEREVKARMSR